ncbi:MAG: hypothetical protein J6D34_04190 [Atopobiaceae bacterium]|nr:hypothetical protein [Atopobiaceae bacterium]
MADHLMKEGGQTASENLSPAERKELWKAERKARREAEKALYQYAPCP